MTPEVSGPPPGVTAAHPWQDSRLVTVIALFLIVALHLVSILRLHPTNLFGLQQDDALYFSSAKALAEGHGYILPSLPGSPAATKYPILYPWFLSFVWRINPNFPANLPIAFALNYLFALAAILLIYFFCRLPLRLPRTASLAVTAFCALHPAFLFYSARLMTDIPFTALTLAFLLFASKAGKPDSVSPTLVRSESSLKWAVLAGILADFSVLMRLAGIAFIAGLLFALILEKYWKTAAAFLASSIPGIFYFIYHGWLRPASAPPAPFSAALPGWQQTWYYFTSYTSFRHLDSPNLSSSSTLLLNQALYLISTVAGYFVSPLADSHIALWLVSSVVFAALLLVASIRRVGEAHLRAALAVFALYLLLLLGWDYVEWTRFLFPFDPLIVVLLFAEGWRCCTLLRMPAKDWVSRALFGLALLCAAGLAVSAAWNYLFSARRSFMSISTQRGAGANEQREVFDWIRSHTDPNDVFITTEYATTYVYTGRQAINFTVLLPSGVYDDSVLERDLDHMCDVAEALHARYWIITDYDAKSQLRAFERPLRERLTYWEATLPRVYTTPAGTIRIYALESSPSQVHTPASPTGDYAPVSNSSHSVPLGGHGR